MELKTILSLEEVLKDFNVVKTIKMELIFAVQKNHPNKEFLIHQELNSLFKNVNLSESFDKKIIIVYDEVLRLEMLLGIHSWLTQQSCNIKNITLIVTHHIGITDWYSNYLNLYGMVGFQLLEAPLLSIRYLKRFESIKPFEMIDRRNNLNFYCSFYGGTYSMLERDFLTTYMFKNNIGYVDYLGGFTDSIEEFDNYLEQLTMFVDRKTVDELLTARHQIQFYNNEGKIINEGFSNTGFQYNIDKQCVFQVIRETLNCVPYSTVTEKTLRSFLHQQIPIPLGTKNVDNLSNLGFDMKYDIIDYEYQYEGNFFKRIVKVVDQINALKNNYSLDDFIEIIDSKKDLIEYNYNYIHSRDLYKNIVKNLIKELVKGHNE